MNTSSSPTPSPSPTLDSTSDSTPSAPASSSRRRTTLLGAAAGLVTGIVALGFAELVAGFSSSWRSPVLDVGDRVIDRVPPPVKDFAIEQFGTNDKLALLIGIGVLVGIYSLILGVVAFRWKLAAGLAGIGAFGIVGVWAALSRRGGTALSAATPTIVGVALGCLALYLAWRTHHRRTTANAAAVGGEATTIDIVAIDDPDALDASDALDPDREVRWDEPAPVIAPTIPQPTGTRRQLFGGAATVLGLLAVAGGAAGVVGRTIQRRFSATESRAALRLPAPDDALQAIPASVSVDVEGVAPFITPNADFYRIDTALTVPQLRVEDYELRVTGMVDRELRLSFDDLLRRRVVEHDITLTCVSNTIGGGLVGNARWLGIRLDDLLAEAGIQPDADQIVGRSIDGYTCGFPVEAATDGRNGLVAFGMNGEPLPLEHGFPVRLIVPGLYGYISATKWLVEIEVTRFDRFEQYWVPRGYADRAPIKLMSRIDSVDGLGTLTRNADGVAAIGGVAWAQTRGISGVEVQIGDGPWQPAELGDALNDDTWRQWAYRWTPESTGRTTIRCRAIDGDGVIQTAERSEPLPNGASGHHQIVVFVA